jgi:hypothetical protein
VRVAQKRGLLEELGSRNWQLVGPEARYVGWVKIRFITRSNKRGTRTTRVYRGYLQKPGMMKETST